MNRGDDDRLQDAIQYARAARMHAGGLSGPELADSGQPLHAALYDLCVIGEALGRVSPVTQGFGPAVPWSAATRLRNRLIHAYWDVDLEIVALTVERDLPGLIHDIEDLLERLKLQGGLS